MKLLGKITRTLLERFFKETTYGVVRGISSEYGIPDFLEEEKVVKSSKEELLSEMLMGVVSYDRVKMLIGDIGVEEFCDHWAEYISQNDDILRVKAAGEFDVLNMKINYVINRFVKVRG